MKRSWQAMLISALVFPGAGQCFLHRYRRGLWQIAVAAAALVGMVFALSMAVLEGMERGALARMDVEGIFAGLGSIFWSSLALFTVVWIYSLGEAYRLGGLSEK